MGIPLVIAMSTFTGLDLSFSHTNTSHAKWVGRVCFIVLMDGIKLGIGTVTILHGRLPLSIPTPYMTEALYPVTLVLPLMVDIL